MAEKTIDFDNTSGNLYDIDIYFIPYLDKELYKFDLDTLEQTLVLSPKDITLGYGPHLCPLSNNLLFIQGGIINQEFVSDSFTINLNTGEITEKSYGPINAAGACIRYCKHIYIFGGATRHIYTPSDLCQRYNIEEDIWNHFTPLPVASYNNTGTLLENKVAIVGQHLSNLYYFDLESETYSTGINISETYKLISSYNRAIFIILNSIVKVYENNTWKDYPRSIQGLYSLIYSYAAYRNGYIYFIVAPRNALRLNINTKVLEIL